MFNSFYLLSSAIPQPSAVSTTKYVSKADTHTNITLIYSEVMHSYLGYFTFTTQFFFFYICLFTFAF